MKDISVMFDGMFVMGWMLFIGMPFGLSFLVHHSVDVWLVILSSVLYLIAYILLFLFKVIKL